MFWRHFWVMQQLRTFFWRMPYVFINMDQVEAKKQLRSVILGKFYATAQSRTLSNSCAQCFEADFEQQDSCAQCLKQVLGL